MEVSCQINLSTEQALGKSFYLVSTNSLSVIVMSKVKKAEEEKKKKVYAEKKEKKAKEVKKK